MRCLLTAKTACHQVTLVTAIALLGTALISSRAANAQNPFNTRGSSSESGANSPEGEREIRAVNCNVRYINKVDIPAKADGTLTELKFEEGDTVAKDDVLAIIDDTAARLAVDLKKAEEKEAVLNAANDINLRDAQNNEKVAAAEYESYKELRREGAIPYWEMEKKRLEAERQRLRIELAKRELKIALVRRIAKQSELDMAQFEVTKRKVTSPATGFIEKRIAQIGQWVQAGSPIATLIQMDRLRVEGDIDALRYPGVVEKGTPVRVTVYQGARSIEVTGEIGFISMEVDLNDRNNIWVEIKNEKFGNDWKFKPGMKAEIVIK